MARKPPLVDVQKDGNHIDVVPTLNFTGGISAKKSLTQNRVDVSIGGAYTGPSGAEGNSQLLTKTATARNAGILLADGRAMKTGGYTADEQSLPTRRCETYDPVTREWTEAAPMGVERFGHSQVRLPNGKILVVGGVQTPSPFNTGAYSVEIYDPVTNAWGSAFSSVVKNVVLPAGPSTVSLLPEATGALYTDDTGFVALNVFSPSLPANAADLAVGAVFKQVPFPGPVTPGQYQVDTGLKQVNINAAVATRAGIAFIHQTATVGPNNPAPPNIVRSLTNAVLLPNGKVLIIGGYHAQGGNSGAVVFCELYDPVTGTWAMTDSLSDARYLGRFAQPAVMASGRVLVAGGEVREPSDPAFNAAVDVLFSSEIYDPILGLWALGPPMESPRAGQVQVPVPAGGFMAGGVTNTGGVLRTAEIYDEALNFWPQVPGKMNTARDSAGAVSLPGGGVFIQGGFGTHTTESNFHKSSEQYDALSGLFETTSAPPPDLGDVNQDLVRLVTGDVLIWGGTTDEATLKPSNVSALYTPGANH